MRLVRKEMIRNSFWEIAVEGRETIITRGLERAGADESVKKHATPAAAQKYAKRQISAVKRKGYIEAERPLPFPGFLAWLRRFVDMLELFPRTVVHSCEIGPPLSASELAAFEQQLGHPLPESLRQLCLQVNGLAMVWGIEGDSAPTGIVDIPSLQTLWQRRGELDVPDDLSCRKLTFGRQSWPDGPAMAAELSLLDDFSPAEKAVITLSADEPLVFLCRDGRWDVSGPLRLEEYICSALVSGFRQDRSGLFGGAFRTAPPCNDVGCYAFASTPLSELLGERFPGLLADDRVEDFTPTITPDYHYDTLSASPAGSAAAFSTSLFQGMQENLNFLMQEHSSQDTRTPAEQALQNSLVWHIFSTLNQTFVEHFRGQSWDGYTVPPVKWMLGRVGRYPAQAAQIKAAALASLPHVEAAEVLAQYRLSESDLAVVEQALAGHPRACADIEALSLALLLRQYDRSAADAVCERLFRVAEHSFTAPMLLWPWILAKPDESTAVWQALANEEGLDHHTLGNVICALDRIPDVPLKGRRSSIRELRQRTSAPDEPVRRFFTRMQHLHLWQGGWAGQAERMAQHHEAIRQDSGYTAPWLAYPDTLLWCFEQSGVGSAPLQTLLTRALLQSGAQELLMHQPAARLSLVQATAAAMVAEPHWRENTAFQARTVATLARMSGGSVEAARAALRSGPPPFPVAPTRADEERHRFGVDMEMVHIPAGAFEMGASMFTRPLEDSALPRHTVRFTRGLWVGVTAVTQALWSSVLGEVPGRFKGDELPVECISWCDAVVFANRLSEAAGLTPAYRLPEGFSLDMSSEESEDLQGQVVWDRSADGFRLLTEAEWEHVAGAGTDTRFWSGEGEADLDRTDWYAGNTERPRRVGLKPSSPWGLRDVHGNVSTWLFDGWRDTAYTRASREDPCIEDSLGARSVRGGQWNAEGKLGAVHRRTAVHHSQRDEGRGLRLARTAGG